MTQGARLKRGLMGGLVYSRVILQARVAIIPTMRPTGVMASTHPSTTHAKRIQGLIFISPCCVEKKYEFISVAYGPVLALHVLMLAAADQLCALHKNWAFSARNSSKALRWHSPKALPRCIDRQARR